MFIESEASWFKIREDLPNFKGKQRVRVCSSAMLTQEHETLSWERAGLRERSRWLLSLGRRRRKRAMRQLSSSMTFFYKFIFPTFWIGMFTFGTLLMFIAPDSFKGNGDVREMRWLFAFITVVGGSFIYWACMRLKTVSMSADALIISNYRRRIDVPLRDVEAISGSLLMSPELIWLRFRHPTPFGEKVVFMPKFRFFSFHFSRHPLVAELQALISSSTTHA